MMQIKQFEHLPKTLLSSKRYRLFINSWISFNNIIPHVIQKMKKISKKTI